MNLIRSIIVRESADHPLLEKHVKCRNQRETEMFVVDTTTPQILHCFLFSVFRCSSVDSSSSFLPTKLSIKACIAFFKMCLDVSRSQPNRSSNASLMVFMVITLMSAVFVKCSSTASWSSVSLGWAIGSKRKSDLFDGAQMWKIAGS